MTDRYNQDTDGDGVTDYWEIAILGTNPLLIDSDNNGISDADEDFDNDGLSNLFELINGMNPLCNDSDFDGLSDDFELEFGTSPILYDTDGDGLSDYEEFLLGTDPKSASSNGDELNKKIFTSEQFSIEDNINIEMEIEGSLKDLSSFSMEKTKNQMLKYGIPGVIGSAYDFEINGEFEKAKLTIEFDEKSLQDEAFVPAIYYYNEELQIFEELDNQELNGNTISVELEHFSTYVLLNKTEYEKVFNTDIRKPNESGEQKNLNMVFAIDISNSMEWNDPEWVRKYVTKQFISELSENDLASIVMFRKTSEQLCELTNNKSLLEASVDKLFNDSGYDTVNSGTNGSNALKLSIDILNNMDNYNDKIIIFLTDGEDTYTSYNYNDLINKARQNNITIYTIGLGDNINESNLKNIAASTEGQYYKAFIASDLVQKFIKIKGETVDYWTDSNADGISDYYTKLICEGKLLLGSGKTVFENVTYEEIQKSADFDGDKLKNGEEIQIVTKGDKVYIKMKSHPQWKDSDYDSYTDYEELKIYNTNALKYNINIDFEDVYAAGMYENYYTLLYKERYQNSNILDSTIWVGNNIYGSNHSQVTMHKQWLISLFEEINIQMAAENEKQFIIQESVQYVGLIRDLLERSTEVIEKIYDNSQYMIDLQNQIFNLKKATDDILSSASKISSIELNEQLNDLCSKIVEAKYKYSELDVLVPDKLILPDKYLKGFERFKKALKGVEIGLYLLEYGFSIQEAIDDYSKLWSNITVIEQNVYILDSIIKNSTDNNLKSAASELRKVADGALDLNVSEINQILTNMGNTTLSIVLHVAISRIPVVGFWIELSIGLSNIIVPIDDISKLAYQIYGIGICNEILMNEFNNSVGGNLFNSNNYLFFCIYSDEYDINNILYQYTSVISTIIYGEMQMIRLQKMGPDWLNWLYDLFSDNRENIIKNCQENIEYLKQIRYKYNSIY